MSDELISKIESPLDLKKLNVIELNNYAKEVRAEILKVVSDNGGHLSSNLGAVELSIALHYVFNSPKDKIIFDVGHQCYTHKIITGRRKQFNTLRQDGGITGFPCTQESEHDNFTTGHSSTSLSLGLGLARARDLLDDKYNVISIIGDGALTGGMSYEAINDIGLNKTKMIIILNDNEMSISKNVGAMANYLTKLRMSKGYSRFKENVKLGAKALPFFGDKLVKRLESIKTFSKSILRTGKLFEQFGIKYLGPLDGHNISNMINVLSEVKDDTKPVLIHLVTNKGNGYYEAERDPNKFHGVSPKVSIVEESFSKLAGNALTEFACTDNKIVAISAAMTDGTGLKSFEKMHSDRYFDVGICEQHAVTMSAGMAKAGLKPYFAVYSSFLQRAYDQIVHDVCLNNLPVRFLIDRAGVIGSDGVSHQGIFDLSYLSTIPNLKILSPKDGNELYRMIKFSVDYNYPLAIRYPKSYSIVAENTDYDINTNNFTPFEWEYLKKSDNNVYILACGNRMIDIANSLENINLINARSIKPLDIKVLDNIFNKNSLVITLEDNILKGGFGESVLSYYNQNNLQSNSSKIINLGIENEFIHCLDTQKVFEMCGLTIKNIEKIIFENLK